MQLTRDSELPHNNTQMAAKVQKPRIKVEEVSEKKIEDVPPKEETPKITSFSQLDTAKPEVQSQTLDPTPVKSDKVTPEVETATDTPDISEVSISQEGEEKMSSDDVKEWLKDIRPDTTKEVAKAGGFNFRLFFILLLLFAVLGALVGGLYYYNQKMSGGTDKPQEVVQVTETPMPTPTETPKAEVDLSKIKVNILNGTGIKGEAAKVAALLKQVGFSSDNIKTGNANTSDVKSTSVSLKKATAEGVFDKIKEALGTQYQVEKAVGDLKDTSTFDVEIVIGNKS